MKTTVEIADSLLCEAKAVAAKENLSIRSLIEEGLRFSITMRNAVAVKPFRLRDGSFQGGHGLQPGVEWKDLTTLAYREEQRQDRA